MMIMIPNSTSFSLHASKSDCVCICTDCNCSNTATGIVDDDVNDDDDGLLSLFLLLSGVFGEFNPFLEVLGVVKGDEGNGNVKSLVIGDDNDLIAN